MEQAPVTKTCTKCGEKKDINLFGLQKNINGKYYRKSKCKKCLVKTETERISKIPELDSFYKQKYQTYKHLHKKNALRYYKNNKNKVIIKSVEWASKNPERKKLIDKSIRKSQSEKLTDNHIKRELVKHSKGLLKYCDIPQELVEIQRKQLKLKRDAKKAKENNSN